MDFIKLDYSNRDLHKIGSISKEKLIDQIEIAIFDNNLISKLDNLEVFSRVKKLSIANNRLVEINAIIGLQNLQFLNLCNNSLINIDPLKDLKQLVWLNISGNEIKSLDALKTNVKLKYIDASDNIISFISDLLDLNELHTLNLNGNIIETLKPVKQNLPKYIKSLLIANNAIHDLNEICYLANLNELECLEFHNNPCVEDTNGETIDFRPFILNWCENLKILDGSEITKKESLKSEWLNRHGKGRHFRPGQHLLLVEYLSKHCLLYSNESIEDDIRLLNIAEKENIYECDKIKRSKNDIHDTIYTAYSTTTVDTTLSETNMPLSHKISNNIKQAKSIVNIQLDSDTELLPFGSDFLPSTHYQVSSTMMREINEHEYFGDVNTIPNTRTSTSTLKSVNNSISKSTTYDDYDKRPIKPLDSKSYEKQLSEYTELSQEQIKLAKLKRAAIQAKALERAKLKQQLNTIKAIKQHSQVHNHHNHQQQPRPQQQKCQSMQLTNAIAKQNIKTRSKTCDDIQAHEQTNAYKQNNRRPQQKFNSSTDRNNDKNASSVSFYDRCATKIQSVWRGYYVRNCSIEVYRLFETLKLKRALNYLRYLRKELNELVYQHNEFCKLNHQAYNTLVSMLNNFKTSNDQHKQTTATTQNNSAIFTKDDDLLKENIELKQRIKELEDKCKIFEQTLMESIDVKREQKNGGLVSSQQKKDPSDILEQQQQDQSTQKVKQPTLQPPLRIRLQKVNDKSVVLKWDHNPLNTEFKITGYRIYINNSLRGEVKTSDTKALINGIQEEGEYRINVRTVMDDIESIDSNVVITRVRRRTVNRVDNESSNISSDDTNTNNKNSVNIKQHNSHSMLSSKLSKSFSNATIKQNKHESLTAMPTTKTTSQDGTNNTSSTSTHTPIVID